MWAKYHDEYSIVHVQNQDAAGYVEVDVTLPGTLGPALSLIGSLYVQPSDGDVYKELVRQITEVYDA